MTHHKIDGRTKRALDIAIAKRQVSQDSYRAVLAGEITLQRAKELGRDRGPADTAQGSGDQDEARTGPRSTRAGGTQGGAYCLCGCGELVKNRFRPGHDMRLYGELKRNLEKDPLLRNERFTEEQKAYAKERGLI